MFDDGMPTMGLSKAFDPTVSAENLTSAEPIRLRIFSIMVLLLLVLLVLGFSLFQVNKGTQLHELNSLHLKHVSTLTQYVMAPHPFTDDEIDQLIDIVRLVQQQPLDCLTVINSLDRWLMRVTGTYEAINICQRDVDQGQQTLAMLAAYRKAEVSDAAIRLELENATSNFSFNSEQFLPLVSEVVKITVQAALLVAGLLGGALLTGITIMANGIIRAASKMTDTSRALAISEKNNKHLAHYDSLTGLPNRNAFKNQLQTRMLRVQQSGGHLGLFFIDLDRFKNINDTLGHIAGDQLLKQAGQRLLTIVDNREGVSRMGGDEFTILLHIQQEPEKAAQEIARKILTSLARPFVLDHANAYLTASIGITFYPLDTLDIENLPKYADLAMYHAKNSGKNKFAFFSPSMLSRVHQRLEMEDQLRGALGRNEFSLHYQPLVRLSDMCTVGAEALLRWKRSDGSSVAPVDFIPLAEETGLILDIGEWVLDQACAQCRAWREQGKPSFRVSINVSVKQLKGGEFPALVTRTLQKYQLPGNALDIEVTESLMIEDDEQIMQSLVDLAASGVRLLLDDFGIGYSSFSYLNSLPFDVLKIDRSFIQTASVDGDKQNITASIIAMSHQLNLQVIAEGVETLSALEYLRAQKCEFVQGYFLDKPMPAQHFDIHRDYQSRLPSSDLLF